MINSYSNLGKIFKIIWHKEKPCSNVGSQSEMIVIDLKMLTVKVVIMRGGNYTNYAAT